MSERIVEVDHHWMLVETNERVAVGWVWLGCILDDDGDVIHVIGRPENIANDLHETK